MRTTLLILAGLGLAMAVPAAAKSVTVQYSDLNLTTVKGQKELERRLETAARQACDANRPMTGSRILPYANRECYAMARTQAKQHLAAILADNQLGG